MNKVIHGDCLEIMPSIADKSIDMILVDPPYNISKENDNRDRSKLNSPIMRHKKSLNYDFGEWDNKTRDNFLVFTKAWLGECCRVLKDGGTIISFFNKEDISYLGWEAKNMDIRTRTIFTWCKSNPVPSFRKVNYLSATEYVWIGSKGGDTWTFNFKYQKDMMNYMITPNSSSYSETDHPTEKPLKLISHFIEVHTNPEDTVLDCFAGSGTTSIACMRTKRNYILIEKEEKYIKIINERIDKELQQGVLL